MSQVEAAEKELRYKNAALEKDIAEIKRAEEKANQLATIVQSSEDAIIGKNLDGIITSWNQGAEKIYGYIESEVIGKSISLLIPHGNENEVLSILDRIKSDEVIGHYETTRRTKDDREIQISLTISPILNPEGKIIGVSTIGRDITERKRTEEKYQQLFDASPYGSENLSREKKDISLVLTDLGLPNMTGLEVCQRIKKISSNAHIILTTGFLDPGMKSEFLKAVIQHFLLNRMILRKF
jgi:PAS domain S-box-containing protein